MITPQELVAWQRRCGLRTDAHAAAALGISVVSYRRKRHGRIAITKQNELLILYYEMFGMRWLAVAEAAYKLARLTSLPIPPAVAVEATKMITEVIDMTSIHRQISRDLL
jgi:hypothetical protein